MLKLVWRLPPSHVTWQIQQLNTPSDLTLSEQFEVIQNQAKQRGYSWLGWTPWTNCFISGDSTFWYNSRDVPFFTELEKAVVQNKTEEVEVTDNALQIYIDSIFTED